MDTHTALAGEKGGQRRKELHSGRGHGLQGWIMGMDFGLVRRACVGGRARVLDGQTHVPRKRGNPRSRRES